MIVPGLSLGLGPLVDGSNTGRNIYGNRLNLPVVIVPGLSLGLGSFVDGGDLGGEIYNNYYGSGSGYSR